MIPDPDVMQCDPIEGHESGLIGYLLSDPATRLAVVIDPPCGQTELILALLAERRLRLTQVLRTHRHADDHDDCSVLFDLTGAQLVIAERAFAEHVEIEKLLRVGHGARLAFGSDSIHVLETPGHTADCVSYLWRDRLFCGDVFDLGACAVGDNEADPARLFDSITRDIFTLPDRTLVFPAHPIRGRRVATLAELKIRYKSVLGRGRDAFITEMAFRRLTHPALTSALGSSLQRK